MNSMLQCVTESFLTLLRTNGLDDRKIEYSIPYTTTDCQIPSAHNLLPTTYYNIRFMGSTCKQI